MNTLKEAERAYPSIVERVTTYGVADLAGRDVRWTGKIDDFGDHVSLELHGLPWDALARVLDALDRPTGKAMRDRSANDHLQEPGRNGEHYPLCDCSRCENDAAAITSGGGVAR